MAKAARLTWEVHLDAPELHEPGRVGWLYQPLVRTDAPASFEYDTAWLQGSNAFALDPRLDLWFCRIGGRVPCSFMLSSFLRRG